MNLTHGPKPLWDGSSPLPLPHAPRPPRRWRFICSSSQHSTSAAVLQSACLLVLQWWVPFCHLDLTVPTSVTLHPKPQCDPCFSFLFANLKKYSPGIQRVQLVGRAPEGTSGSLAGLDSAAAIYHGSYFCRGFWKPRWAKGATSSVVVKDRDVSNAKLLTRAGGGERDWVSATVLWDMIPFSFPFRPFSVCISVYGNVYMHMYVCIWICVYTCVFIHIHTNESKWNNSSSAFKLTSLELLIKTLKLIFKTKGKWKKNPCLRGTAMTPEFGGAGVRQSPASLHTCHAAGLTASWRSSIGQQVEGKHVRR